MATILQLKVAKWRLFEKVSLSAVDERKDLEFHSFCLYFKVRELKEGGNYQISIL